MDVDTNQQRMAAYMRDHQDKVVGRWSELVVAGLRGRSSVTEVRRELEDLYSLVVRAMSGSTIGMYRGCRLAHPDKFGSGRNPSDGSTYRKGDLSFWYEVVKDPATDD